MKMIATTPTWRSTRTSSVSSEEDYDKISHTNPTKQLPIYLKSLLMAQNLFL